MSILRGLVSGLRGGAMAANAVKIISTVTGKYPSSVAIDGLKDQAVRFGWRNEHELALMKMMGECREVTLGEEIIKPLDKDVRHRVIMYYESCRERGLLGDYIIQEYEKIKIG